MKPEGLAASPEVIGSFAPTPKPCSSRGYKGPTSVTSPSLHVQGVDKLLPTLGACAQPLAMKPVHTQTQPEYKLPPEHNVQPRVLLLNIREGKSAMKFLVLMVWLHPGVDWIDISQVDLKLHPNSGPTHQPLSPDLSINPQLPNDNHPGNPMNGIPTHLLRKPHQVIQLSVIC